MIAHPSPANRERVETLDLLRVVAVLGVVFYHYAFRGAAADGLTAVSLPDLAPYAKYGSLGVQLFFVISGFVIAYSADGRTAMGFAIARFARIYPAFLVCMTVTFAVTLAIGAPRFEATNGQWLANLIVLSPALKQPFMDGAYWSIVSELTFYAWVFLFLLLGRFRRDIDNIILFWIVVSIVNETVLQSPFLRRLFVTDQSGFFCAGLVLYEIYCGRRGRTVVILLMLASLMAVNQALLAADWDRAHYQVEFDNVVVAALAIACIAAVGLAMCVRRLRVPAPVVAAAGGLTYSMYLLHQHIGYMLLNRFTGQADPATLIVLVFLAILLASFLVWRFIERPARGWTRDALSRALAYLGSRTAPAVPPIARPLKVRPTPPGR